MLFIKIGTTAFKETKGQAWRCIDVACRGTLPYMAPELVSDPERVSEKADVWSLGMVLWEMLTRQVPFTHLTPQQIIAGLMVGNLQPEVGLPAQTTSFFNAFCLLQCLLPCCSAASGISIVNHG